MRFALLDASLLDDRWRFFWTRFALLDASLLDDRWRFLLDVFVF